MQNIVAIDQEIRGLAVVINGERTQIANFEDLALPFGGGVIVADSNVWAVGNGLSQSQYCFVSEDERDKWISFFAGLNYDSISVSTKYAKVQYMKRGTSQADAVDALYLAVKEQVDDVGRFDSGKPVRETRGDTSYGQRDIVVKDFLRMQNSGGYDSEFLDKAVKIAWDALDKEGKKLFNLKITKPEASSPNRISAVLVCTHDPATGLRREHDGKPWGSKFIVRRILCLNGMMQGTGTLSPGSPMRAVLRILGRRWGDKINAEERSALDRQVKILIRAFQQHEKI